MASNHSKDLCIEDKDMQTPVRSTSLEGSNVMESLRRRVASTALRPRTVNHFNTVCLDTPETSFAESTASQPEHNILVRPETVPRPPRASSIWLQEVISNVESLAEKLKLESDKMRTSSYSLSVDSDFSSLDILTPSVMIDSFEAPKSESSESYKALMKRIEEPNHQANTQNTVITTDGATQNDESTLVAREASPERFSFSNLDQGCPDLSMRTSPQADFGFDSKDFIDADSSIIKKRMDEREISLINAPKALDPIPSPQRIDLNEFCGFIGEGEISIRPSWLSPEKRKVISPRMTIGQYFSLRSYSTKELKDYLNPQKESIEYIETADHSIINPKNSNTQKLCDTIDLAEEDPESTINIADSDVETSHMSQEDPANATLGNFLDMTLVPGRDSIMSLTAIASLLNSTKGSDTVVGHLLEAAQQPKPSNKKSWSTLENVPPQSTSRETFVIIPSQKNDTPVYGTIRTHSPLKSDTRMNACPSRIPILSWQKQRSPLKQSKSTPTKKHCYTSPYSRHPKNIIRATGQSLSALQLSQSPVTKKAISTNIKLPLFVEGQFKGIVGLPLMLDVVIENISTSPFSCILHSVTHNKHLQMNFDNSVSIDPGTCSKLKFEVTALVTGEHLIELEVHLIDHAGNELIYSVTPVKISIELPKISIVKQYKDFIDFGLRPEDSTKVEIFVVQNRNSCSVPLKISLKQDLQNPCFFFLTLPEQDGEEEMDLAHSMTFILPGLDQGSEKNSQDVGLIFIPPSVRDLDSKIDRVVLKAQLKVTLNLPDDASNERVLESCTIRGAVGKTLLLVSNTEINLYPGELNALKIHNGGVVALNLNFQATSVPDISGKTIPEPDINIEPSQALLLPGDITSLTLIWQPKVDHPSILNRELHLTYEGLRTGNIVSLMCHKSRDQPLAIIPTQPKVPLPLKTTRQQLSWGSLSSGQTSKQHISFLNSSGQNLSLNISIQSNDSSNESSFKLLSETEEVTRSIVVQLRPGRMCRVTVMFCPLRLGPTVAVLNIASSDARYTDKKLPLNGYGGHANVVLRNVSIAQGRTWLVLQAGLGDFVAESFSLVNNGTLPACVVITSMPVSNFPCSPTVKPDSMIIPARSTQVVSVRLPDVSNILCKIDSGEVVTLCALKITWMNEVTRVRLRKLLPKLNNSERVMLLKLENLKLVHNLLYVPTDSRELLPNTELDKLVDYSYHTVVCLSKDMVNLELELRSRGTGHNNHINTDGETASPFVSFMDTMSIPTSSLSDEALSPVETRASDISSSTDAHKEWSISPKILVLQPTNNYSSVVHVCNLSASQRLCLDVQSKNELSVSPIVADVRPCETLTLEVRLHKPLAHHATWPDAIKVYTANDVESVSVKVLPFDARKMQPLATLQPAFTPCKKISYPFVLPYSLTQCNTSLPFVNNAAAGNPTDSTTQKTQSRKDVYLDTECLCFPWTKVGTSSSVTIKHVSPPFSVEPLYCVVSGLWHKSITVIFKPTVVNAFTERLELTVEDQLEPVYTQLEGHAVL